MTRTSRNTAATAALAATLFFSAGSSAVAVAREPSMRHFAVKYSDLDLTTDTGVAILKSRAELAVKGVCGPAEKFPSTDFESYQACYDAAMADTSRAMNRLVAGIRSKHQLATVDGSPLNR